MSLLLITIIKVIAIFAGVITSVALMTLAELKISAFIQYRHGPNRVGPSGLFQTIADALKLVTKELTGTDRADMFLYNLAPYFVIVAALVSLSVLPFSGSFQAFDINIGVFFIMAVSSIGVIGILLGGWASNNKYSLIGAMRSGLQTVSY